MILWRGALKRTKTVVYALQSNMFGVRRPFLAPRRHVMWASWWVTWSSALVLFLCQLGVFEGNNLRQCCFFLSLFYCPPCIFFNTMSNTFYCVNGDFFKWCVHMWAIVCVRACVRACVCLCVCPVGCATVRTGRTVNQSRVSPASMRQTLMRNHCGNTKRHDATKASHWKEASLKSFHLPSWLICTVQGPASQTQSRLSSKIPLPANTQSERKSGFFRCGTLTHAMFPHGT